SVCYLLSADCCLLSADLRSSFSVFSLLIGVCCSLFPAPCLLITALRSSFSDLRPYSLFLLTHHSSCLSPIHHSCESVIKIFSASSLPCSVLSRFMAISIQSRARSFPISSCSLR